MSELSPTIVGTPPKCTAISVVIPSARDYPAQLIETLLGQLGNQDELLLVNDSTWSGESWSLETTVPGVSEDTGNGSNTQQLYESHTTDDRFQKLQTTGDGGGAVARNIGWRNAQNDWILFLNDDLIISASFVDDAKTAINSSPNANVVSYRVRPSETTTPWARLAGETTSLDRGARKRTLEDPPVELNDVWQYGVGAALATHRRALTTVRGYKGRLGPGRKWGGTDDIELLWHISQHRGVLAYDGTVGVHHPPPSSFEEWKGKLEDYGKAIGYLAGSVGSQAARNWMTGYCDLLSDTVSTEVFNTLSVFNQERVEDTLKSVIHLTKQVYTVSKQEADESLYCCSECRSTAV